MAVEPISTTHGSIPLREQFVTPSGRCWTVAFRRNPCRRRRALAKSAFGVTVANRSERSDSLIRMRSLVRFQLAPHARTPADASARGGQVVEQPSGVGQIGRREALGEPLVGGARATSAPVRSCPARTRVEPAPRLARSWSIGASSWSARLDGPLEPDLGFGRRRSNARAAGALEQQQLRRQHLRFGKSRHDLQRLVDAGEALAGPSGQTEHRGVEVQERRPEDRAASSTRGTASIAASKRARPSSTEPVAAIAAPCRHDPAAVHTGNSCASAMSITACGVLARHVRPHGSHMWIRPVWKCA